MLYCLALKPIDMHGKAPSPVPDSLSRFGPFFYCLVVLNFFWMGQMPFRNHNLYPNLGSLTPIRGWGLIAVASLK